MSLVFITLTNTGYVNYTLNCSMEWIKWINIQLDI